MIGPGPGDDFAQVVDAGDGKSWSATPETMIIGRDLPSMDMFARLTADRSNGRRVSDLGRFLQVGGVQYKRHPVYMLAEAGPMAIEAASVAIVNWVRERHPNCRFVEVARTPQYLDRRGIEAGHVPLRRPRAQTDPPSPFDHSQPPRVLLGGYYFAIPSGTPMSTVTTTNPPGLVPEPASPDAITRGISPLDVMTPEQLAVYAEWQSAVRELKRIEKLMADAKQHAQQCTAKMAELAGT